MIRKAVTEDIDFVYQLYMHPQINPWLLYEPMDKESFRPIFAELLQKGVKYIYNHDGTDSGMFKLVPFTHRTSHIVYLGGLAIHPSFAGKGLGLQLMNEIISFARHQGFKRIELGVDMINEKAFHLYKKAGFEKEGIMKKYVYLKKENIFLDEVMMAYLVNGE
jgi:L-phenylalanine/L-methionine N-acetyltransferase